MIKNLNLKKNIKKSVIVMNDCEIFSNLKVPCGLKIVVRADGRNFSRLSNDLGLKKPYDTQFVKSMVEASCIFAKEFSPVFIYIFSDEINILLSEIPFGGRVEKIDSIFASFLGSAFTKTLSQNLDLSRRLELSRRTVSLNNSQTKPISFDARIIPLTSSNLVEYFKMRQKEAWRNCINGYAYWTLREEYGKEKAVEMLNGKKSSKLHDILFDKGINLSEVPAWQRRGVGIYKKEVYVEGYNPISKEKVLSRRDKLYIDWDMPLFQEEFFRDNYIL